MPWVIFALATKKCRATVTVITTGNVDVFAPRSISARTGPGGVGSSCAVIVKSRCFFYETNEQALSSEENSSQRPLSVLVC